MSDDGTTTDRVNFRASLREMFRRAIEGLVADGTLGVAASEIPAILEQVRETADAKFGDYSASMAMPLAKRAGRKPRDLAVAIAARLVEQPGYTTLFEPPGDPVGPGFINSRPPSRPPCATNGSASPRSSLPRRSSSTSPRRTSPSRCTSATSAPR